MSPETVFDLKLNLISELEDLFGCRVDVVVLNTASLKIIRQVMRTGRRVYTVDPDAETAFRLQKQKEYFDFQFYLEDDRAALKAYFRA